MLREADVGHERRLLAVAVVAPLAVSAIVAVSLWHAHWLPVGDWAALWLRADDVMTVHTPLVGAYSVRGWSHPGPSIFWVVWALEQLSFHSVPRAFALMALLNGATVSATVVMARRWFGTQTALVTALVGTALCHALGGAHLGEFWNPYPPVVWFFAFVVGLAAVALGNRAGAATWSAAFGSLVAQAHVSFAFLVAFLLVVVVVSSWRRSPRRRVEPPGRRPWLWLLAAMWSPVLIDLVAGRHNLTRIWDYFGSSTSQRLGFAPGLDVVSRELAPWGPLVRGGQPHYIGGVLGAPWWWLVVPMVAIGFLLIGPTRVSNPHRARVQLAALSFGFLWVMTAALQGYIFDYLITFLIAAAAAFWWVVLVAGTTYMTTERSSRLGGAAVVAAIIAITVTAAATDPARARLPEQEDDAIVQATADRLEARIGLTHKPVVVDYLDDPGVVAAGVTAILSTHYDLRTGDQRKLLKWGFRRAQIPRRPDQAYTLVVVYPDQAVLRPNQCVLRSAGRPSFDVRLLDASDEREFARLRIENYTAKGHLAPAAAARYAYLRNRSIRVLVFRGLYRQTCGRLPK